MIIVNWNTRDALRGCLASLAEGCAGVPFETWVVDNASDDGSAEMVSREFPQIHLIRNSENLGLTKAANLALRKTRADFCLCLNSDAALAPGAARVLVDFLESRLRAAAVGPRIVWPDGRVQPSTYPPLSLWRESLRALHLYSLMSEAWKASVFLGAFWSHDRARRVGRLTGACWLIRRSSLERLGFLDERFWDGSAHDFCVSAARRGEEIWFCPEAQVTHHLGASARRRWTPEGRRLHTLEETKRLMIKHEGLFWFQMVCLMHWIGYALSSIKRGPVSSTAEFVVEWRWYGQQIFD